MANINIYGTLFSDASKDNDKVIVLGSQVYGNDTSAPAKDESGAYPETGKLISKNEFKGLLGTDWTSGLVPGSQYDINRFFKAKINNISANYVPYTGATKDVSLGSHAITSGSITANGLVNSSSGFYLTNKLTSIPTSIDANSGVYLLTNYSGGYNCLQLWKLYSELMFTSSGNGKNSLIGHLNTLYSKVNHITQPLRFKGVINEHSSHPTLPTSGVEVGDVWHFNTDVTPYYEGDDVVCTSISPNITWEILGQNITPIPKDNITIQNLES